MNVITKGPLWMSKVSTLEKDHGRQHSSSGEVAHGAPGLTSSSKDLLGSVLVYVLTFFLNKNPEEESSC